MGIVKLLDLLLCPVSPRLKGRGIGLVLILKYLTALLI